jgi:hypothetical protein
MSVWQLLRALLGHTLHGRGRYRVYVVPDGSLPDPVHDELDNHDWTIVKTYTPYRRQDRFVVAVIKPQRRTDAGAT